MRISKRMSLLKSSLPVVGDNLRIFVLNDLHFRAGVDGNPGASGAIGGSGIDTRYYYASPNNIRNFVQIANTERPDLILVNGDICDHPNDFALFNTIWSGLDPSIPYMFTPGNHDFDDLTYAQLVDTLGYASRPEVGGSKFNHTFAIGDNTRVIVVDTTFNTSDTHGNHYLNVRMHTDSVGWIADILATTPERQIYIATHVGPQLVSIGYFNSTQATQIRDVVASASIARKLKVRWMFGHHHLPEIETYGNLGQYNDGYLLPALILQEEGRYTEIAIVNGEPTFARRPLAY